MDLKDWYEAGLIGKNAHKPTASEWDDIASTARETANTYLETQAEMIGAAAQGILKWTNNRTRITNWRRVLDNFSNAQVDFYIASSRFFNSLKSEKVEGVFDYGPGTENSSPNYNFIISEDTDSEVSGMAKIKGLSGPEVGAPSFTINYTDAMEFKYDLYDQYEQALEDYLCAWRSTYSMITGSTTATGALPSENPASPGSWGYCDVFVPGEGGDVA